MCDPWRRNLLPVGCSVESRHLSLFPGLLLAGLAVLLPACGGKSSGSILKPPKGGGGEPVDFGPGDLAGDWIGLFQPANPLKKAFNFVIRFNAAGNATMACNGLGHEWEAGTATLDTSITSEGGIDFFFQTFGGLDWRMSLSGSMSDARDRLKGSFEVYVDGILFSSGQFEADLSSGPGQFHQSLLQGTWNGVGYKRFEGRHRRIVLELDGTGTVLGGDIEVHNFIPGGVNTGIFDFSDTSMGRLDNVVMQSTDGSTQTFHFLLVDLDGTVMSGPGTDSTMGTGVVRLGQP